MSILVHKPSGYITITDDTKDIFENDPENILIALRLAIQHRMLIDDKTTKEILKHKELVKSIPKENVTKQFRMMLKCNKPIIEIFTEFSDIIALLIPEIKSCIGFNQNNKYHQHEVYEHMLYVVDGCDTEDFEIKLAALLHDIGKPASYTVDDAGWGHFYGHPEASYEIAKKVLQNDFTLGNDENDMILDLVRYHDIAIASTQKAVRRLLINHGKNFVYKWVILKGSDKKDHINITNWRYNSDLEFIKEETERLVLTNNDIDLMLNGHDVMRLLGIPESPHVGYVLKTIKQEVKEGLLENTYGKLRKRALELKD